MLINKAAALALVLTNLSLPATLRVTHNKQSLSVTPTISTASAKTVQAETATTSTDVPSQDSDDPPSTPSVIAIDPTPLPTVAPTPTPKPQKGPTKAKATPQKPAKTIKHTATPKKPEISQPEQRQKESLRIIGKSNEQCVIYARRITGNQKIRGYAGNLKPEGHEPRIGAGALDKRYGHVAVVIAIDGEWLIIHDANYKPGFITERRVHKSTQRGYIY